MEYKISKYPIEEMRSPKLPFMVNVTNNNPGESNAAYRSRDWMIHSKRKESNRKKITPMAAPIIDVFMSNNSES